MGTLNRKQFLGGIGCTAVGAVVGAYLPRALVREDSTGSFPPAPRRAHPTAPIASGEESFSQCGEDLNIAFNFRFLKSLKETKITYMDVGAHHPTEISNTYYFYRKGCRGVLVEPNAFYCRQLREVRPGDTTLEAGIGISDATEADYYLMSSSGLNTFSKEQAERLVSETQGKLKIEEVRKVPLLNINDVMEKHFEGAPAFISIDTEGLDLDILKTVDFSKYRPKLLCVETLVTNTMKDRPEIAEYLATKHYTARGGSLVNTIFIDDDLL